MSFAEPLARHAGERGSKAAIVTKDTSLTFAELDQRTDQLAAGLRALGLSQGDVVAVMVPTGIPSVVSTIAVLKAGLVHVGINVLFKEEEVGHILADSGARAMIVQDRFVQVVENARPPGLEWLVSVGEAPAGTYPWDALLEGPPDAADRPEGPAPDSPAALIYTSGTTGMPKGAVHDHQNLVRQTAIATSYFQLSPDDRAIGALPTFLLPPFFSCAWYPLASGATLFLQERFKADEALDEILAERINFMIGTKTMLFLFNELPERSNENLEFMRVTAFGGMPQPPEVRMAFEERFNRKTLHIYGMSETVNMLAGTPLDLDEDIRRATFESVGRPLEGLDIQVLREDGTPADPDEPGEVCIRDDGRGMWKPMLGYHDKPDETKRALQEHWLHTGDMGHIDSWGMLYVKGRATEMIKVSGWSVFPVEIETLLSRDERVEQVAVAPVSDHRSGQRPVAFIQLRSGCTAEESEFADQVARGLAKFKQLKDVEFVEELPVNLYGKVQKHRLTELYERTHASTGSA